MVYNITMKSLREALFFNQLSDGKVLCTLCNHFCLIEEGKTGKCRVRLNQKGKLYSLNYGKGVSFAMDPIEKKPFFHFKPGTHVLSFGTPGCNFQCLNCQNWDLRQAMKEIKNPLEISPTYPEQIAEMAINNQADGIAYTYSEPTIFFEYAYDCIRETRKRNKNLFHVFVSNGYFSKQLLDFIYNEKLLQAIRIDLKFIDEKKYMEVTGGRLKPVLENIRNVYQKGIHIEVINLIIPTLNDTEEDIKKTVEAVKSVSPDIPLHFSAFHPDYKLTDLPRTPLTTLLNAKK